MKRSTAVSGSVACMLAMAGLANGQRGSNDWMTTGNDAQRSSWVRGDGKISPHSMSKPGFELVWKMKLEPNVTPPALLDFYIGYRGFRTLAFFGASTDKVIAVDTDLARPEWENRYNGAAGAGGAGCPGGMTSAVTRPTSVEYPPLPSSRGGGRGSPAKSGVGEPHEGSVVLAAMMARAAAAPPPRPVTAAAKPSAAPAPSPFAPHIQYVLALSADGKLHSMWLSNGNEADAAVPFVPPNAHALGLVAYGNTAYVATTGNCGQAGNGVWSMDLATHVVKHWKSSGEVAGTAGPAVGPNGTLYVAAGKDLVALSHDKLETLGIYRADREFNSSPVVFEYRGRDLVAAATEDGRVHLLDAASLNGEKPVARSEPISAAGHTTGALASWQDLAGTRWVLVPADGATVALKIVESDGKLSLATGWRAEMKSPLTPIIVNGVVFAVSRSTPSVLYALDAITGKGFWNSGTAIQGEVRGGGLAAGGSRVYVATHDGTQYAFGFPIEH